MPECKECSFHHINFPEDVSGYLPRAKREYPSLYHKAPVCPSCGLIGNAKKSKLKDALWIVKSRTGSEEKVLEFMRFYRKRGSDFKDDYSAAMAFLERPE